MTFNQKNINDKTIYKNYSKHFVVYGGGYYSTHATQTSGQQSTLLLQSTY